MNTTVTTDSTAYSNYCSSRLPCGICRLTMQVCPMWNGCGIHIMPTWGVDKTEITCSVDRKGEEDA